MALIQTIDPDVAEGLVKQFYDTMKKLVGMVPKPLQMYSASPRLFEINTQILQYYMSHPNLNPVLMACIRFVSATHCEYPYCIDMNKKILTQMVGLSEQQVQQLLEDPKSVDLPEKDKAMLDFVIKSIRTPEEVQQNDVDELRRLGWLDTDIYDAVSHGTMMVASGILFNAFKMGV